MAIRSKIAKSNPYYISKHRYLELKHFCLQYQEWQELYLLARAQTLSNEDDPTGYFASVAADCEYCMKIVEWAAENTDKVIAPFIFSHATKGSTYENLRTRYEMPCGRELFYQYMRKFYFLLSEEKGV